MRNFIKYIMILSLLSSILYSAPARGGILTFTQPDGSTFNGLLKGDSSFHWIESNGRIVMLNRKDRFFYVAEVTKEGKLAITTRKPIIINEVNNRSAQSAALYKSTPTHRVDDASKKALRNLYKTSKQGSHPR